LAGATARGSPSSARQTTTPCVLDGLRQNRILNEALETTDPLRLMRLFGISDQTATRYVGAAHPERTSKLPR
jgi:hypothetical protein